MFLDSQLLLSDAQALTVTAVSTNVIDLSQGRAIGDGEELAVVISVDVAADATTGDETYQFTIQMDDNVGFATPVNLTTVIYGTLPSIPRAELSAGAILVLPFFVASTLALQTHVRLNYTLGGTTPTVTVTASVMGQKNAQKYRSYAKGYVIS